MDKLDLCALLTYAVEAAEKVAPTTATKWDDFVLLGLKIAKQRACKEATFAAADLDGYSEGVIAAAEQFADELLAKCPCDDCEC